jgi:hypothetical protein
MSLRSRALDPALAINTYNSFPAAGIPNNQRLDYPRPCCIAPDFFPDGMDQTQSVCTASSIIHHHDRI